MSELDCVIGHSVGIQRVGEPVVGVENSHSFGIRSVVGKQLRGG